MDPTTLRMVAVAATVLGVTGTASMILYRIALGCVDLAVIPLSLMPRLRWWTDHLAPALGASLALVLLGLVGLVST
jgi:hypothetical protein